jgi:raffinose/stachyose/melibiose transport system substrate-binding protein
MKNTNRLLALAAAILLPALAWSLPKVAVLDLSLQKGIDATVAAPVTESLMEEVVGARAYVVLDRAYIEQVLKEKEFQLSGMVSDTQVAQAGQYLGADYVVAGKIQLVGDTYFVVAKMIEVKTGVIVAQSSEQGEGKIAVLLNMAHAVGKKLVSSAPITALSPSSSASSDAAAQGAAAQGASQASPAKAAAAQGPAIDDPVPSGAVSLTVFALRDFKGSDAPAWNAAMDAFARKYPNIKISEENVKDVGLYYQKLWDYTQSKRTPDLFYLGGESSYTAQFPAKDLRPLLRGREKELLVPALRPRAPDGAVPFLPLNVATSHVLYARGDILQRLGLPFARTVDELIAQVPAIRKAGLTPIAMADKDGWEMQSCLLSVLLDRTGGADWLRRAATGKGGSFKDSAFVAALDIIKRLVQAKAFAPDILSEGYDVPLNMFLQGKAAYMIDGGWRAAVLAGSLDRAAKDALVVGAFPDVPNQAGPSGSTTTNSQGYAINPALEGDKAAAAWLWLWFLSGPEGQAIRTSNGVDLTGIGLDPRKFSPDVDPVYQKLYDFLSAAPEADILDLRIPAITLNTGIQQLMAGTKTSASVAADFESWAAKNGPNRSK